jgi:caffeoyl-CoA O-methyltransferase
MSDKTFSVPNDPRILAYLKKTFVPEDDVLRTVVERSKSAGLPPIQVGDMDGLHLEVLARAVGARKIVEVGTLGGYSGIHLARALPPGGKLYTFEMNPMHARIAQESFALAGVSDRIEILVGSANENLSRIESQGPFDLMFIDADKTGYPRYLDWAERHLRVGGVVLGDNTLGFGMIADETFDDREDESAVRALREFNARIATGGRFRGTMLPTGEGLTFGVKIS